MTNMICSELVLKTDNVGRVITPRERREEILAEFDRSGMSGLAFASHYGIKYQTFVAWRKKRREGQVGIPANRISLVEAVIATEAEAPVATGGSVQVRLPGGASIEIGNQHEAGLVACLIRNLALGSC